MRTKRSEKIINILEYLLDDKLPLTYVQWVEDYADVYRLGICSADCLCSKLDWLDKYEQGKILFVQDSDVFNSMENINLDKYTFILIPYEISGKNLKAEEEIDYLITLSKPKSNENPKTQTIYGIRTTDDEYGHSSIKAHCLTYDIAVREIKNHCNWWSPHPVSEESIEEIKLIIE